jgi:hypothetical protein
MQSKSQRQRVEDDWLNKLECLLSGDPSAERDVERLMRPLPTGDLWKKLVNRIQRELKRRLKELNSRTDISKRVVLGKAWRTKDGRIEHTWLKAEDGKKVGKKWVEILLVADEVSGLLTPHHGLIGAAAFMLGKKQDEDAVFESEEARFWSHVQIWESVAQQHIERIKPSKLLKDAINDGYESAKQVLLDEESKGKRKLSNPRAHNLASLLLEQCCNIREFLSVEPSEREFWFMGVNCVVNAKGLFEELLQSAAKGNAVRLVEMLERKGRDTDPFTDAVRDASEIFYLKNGRRPHPKEVFDELGAVFVQKNGKWNILTAMGVSRDWNPSTIKAFHKAVESWVKSAELPHVSGSRRPPKGMELPNPPGMPKGKR